jgi:hypothetical protein
MSSAASRPEPAFEAAPEDAHEFGELVIANGKPNLSGGNRVEDRRGKAFGISGHTGDDEGRIQRLRFAPAASFPPRLHLFG